MQGQPSVFDGNSWAGLGKREPALLCGWVCMQEPTAFRLFHEDPHNLCVPLKANVSRRTRFLSSDHTFTLFLPETPVWTDRRLRNNTKKILIVCRKKKTQVKTIVYVTQTCPMTHLYHPDVVLQVLDVACLHRFGACVPSYLSDCTVCLFTAVWIRTASAASWRTKSSHAESCTTGFLGTPPIYGQTN